MDKVIKNNAQINKSQRIKTDNWLYYCHLTKYHLFDELKRNTSMDYEDYNRDEDGNLISCCGDILDEDIMICPTCKEHC